MDVFIPKCDSILLLDIVFFDTNLFCLIFTEFLAAFIPIRLFLCDCPSSWLSMLIGFVLMIVLTTTIMQKKV